MHLTHNRIEKTVGLGASPEELLFRQDRAQRRCLIIG
jgi:hypothetical protein